MLKKLKPQIISVIIALAVGGLSALLTKNNMSIFEKINMPPLSPPSVVFPIVWAVLYILMGISSAIIYKNGTDREEVQSALKVYALQLAVNFFWSLIFFNMQAYLFAFIWLVLLWVLVIVMIVKFKKISPAAAWLQIPYLLWITFAGYLSLMIYLLNG